MCASCEFNYTKGNLEYAETLSGTVGLASCDVGDAVTLRWTLKMI